MEKLKSILSPGKHVEDEILYGSGGGGQYEHTGREVPGSTGGGYYGQASSQPQIYNRERDSIPSQPSTAQDYGKTGDECLAAEKEQAAKSKLARELSTGEKKNGNGNGHRNQQSGEHKESRNPYTQQAVDPRLGGGAKESKIAAHNAQAQAIGAGYSPPPAIKTAQGYDRESAAGRGSQGAAAAGLVGAAGGAGAAGAAGTTAKSATIVPLETDSPHGEVVGRTISGHHTVERTASGQYRTRLASIIDPNYGGGVKTSESAYEHTPGGGGAYTADKFHKREPRVASITLPNGTKYIDPKAAEDYGLGYKHPAGYGAQGQPQVATTKSEADHALSGDQAGYKGAGVVGAGVAGAAVADAGYEGTKTDRAHPRDVDDPAYRTSRAQGAEETYEADKAAKKSVAQAAPAPAERLDESAYAAKSTAAKYGGVDVPPGNDYGKGVKDPRYGLPMAAAGISAEEAAALRRNEANVARASQGQAYASRPTTAEQDSAAQPAAAGQAYGTQHATQAEQQAAKHAKEEKPSRRSSILGFLHLGKDKKRQSKGEKPQPYTDLTGQAPVGSVAGTGVGQQQPSVPGSTAGHGQAADLAYRNRMPSTADVPAFTGGLVGPNGTPLTGASAANADSSAWAKSTEKEVMDRGGIGQGAYGSGGGTGAGNQAAYGTGIDESYANQPAGTAGTQKSGSHGVATTGGAIAAGAAAGGLAAGGTQGSKAHEGVASDYNLQSAQDKGAPTQDHHYDQVSPRSSKAQQQTNHKETTTNHTKETTKSNHKSHNHKEKNNTAYADSEGAQTRDAEYGGYENDPRMGSAAQGGYGSDAPAYDTSAANGTASSSAAYGGKETRASNSAYSGGAQNANEAAFGDESYVGSGVSRHDTTKVAEREGHHVLHKDPPASHPAAAMAGVE